MEFLLFSKIPFEIPEPIALIECYCYQNDFYSKYDLLEDKKIEDVNKIGARIKKEVLLECKIITERIKSLNIFKYNLEQFSKEGQVLKWHIFHQYLLIVKKMCHFKTWPPKLLHTSGHAEIATLKKVVKKLKPGRIIPIHTFYPDKYSGLFNRKIVQVSDGEVFVVWGNTMPY